jgi:hypothetical protein
MYIHIIEYSGGNYWGYWETYSQKLYKCLNILINDFLRLIHRLANDEWVRGNKCLFDVFDVFDVFSAWGVWGELGVL